jgi:hypothetical protein
VGQYRRGVIGRPRGLDEVPRAIDVHAVRDVSRVLLIEPSEDRPHAGEVALRILVDRGMHPRRRAGVPAQVMAEMIEPATVSVRLRKVMENYWP